MIESYPKEKMKSPTECYAYFEDAEHPIKVNGEWARRYRYVCLAFIDANARASFIEALKRKYPVNQYNIPLERFIYLIEQDDPMPYFVCDPVDGDERFRYRPCDVPCKKHWKC